MNPTLDQGINWGVEIKTSPKDINHLRAKIIFEYGLSEEQLSKEEEIMSIMIVRLLEKHFPVNTKTNLIS